MYRPPARRLFVTALIVGFLLAMPAQQSRANPPDANLAGWKSICYNCYNYGCNLMTALYAQPGAGSGAIVTVPLTPANVTTAAKNDGLRPLVAANTAAALAALKPGECLVYMAVRNDGKDYHWYRYNADKTWSDKMGWAPAMLYKDKNNVTDPSVGDRGNYTQAGGFFAVPMAPLAPPTLGPLPGFVCPMPGAGAAVGKLDMAGSNDTFSQLSTSQLTFAQSLLPEPGDTPIPAPNWPDFSTTLDPADGQYDAGFGLADESSGPLGASFYEVYGGVIAVYSDMEGSNVTYYNDTRGLGSYLQTSVPEPSSLALLGSVAGLLTLRRRGRCAA